MDDYSFLIPGNYEDYLYHENSGQSETNNQIQTTQNLKLAEYMCPDPEHLNVWVREEGGKVIVSVKVAVNKMSVTLRQEESKWVGNQVASTCLGIPPGEEREREDEMYALMSNITNVRIMSFKRRGIKG